MPEAVLFDLDGTLFDDRQYVRAGLHEAGARLESLTGESLTEELLTAYFERSITETTFQTILAEHDLPLDLVPTLVEAYHSNEAPLTPYPDAEPTLSTLAETRPLGLITGGRRGEAKLSRLGLADAFNVVIVTPDLDSSKREPGPFERALDALGADAARAAYVGDRPALDFPQPNRLGMATVRVRRGSYADQEAEGDERPDAIVETLDEVPETLAELLPGRDA